MYRRYFVRTLPLLGAALSVPGVLAQELTLTAPQGEGPFYPDRLPLDTDNDLLIINDAITPAVGTITWLGGKILDGSGSPIRNAEVEIWQVDGNGVYLHGGSDNAGNRDGNFQGYGRFLTGSTGEYLFRTVKPVSYPGRTAHVHFIVNTPGRDAFTTQMYIEGEPRNATDNLLNSVSDTRARASIIVPFEAMPSSRIGELSAEFNVVLGRTPSS